MVVNENFPIYYKEVGLSSSSWIKMQKEIENLRGKDVRVSLGVIVEQRVNASSKEKDSAADWGTSEMH